MGLNTLTEDIVNGAQNVITNNPIASVLGAAAIGGIAGAGIVGITSAVIKKRKKAKRTSTKKTSKRKTKRRSTKYARTAGKRKDRSKKRIRMTKNGQPYVILASGKARFISKRSAKLSRSRKGGRY